MLKLDKVVDTSSGQLRKTCGIELLTRDGENHLAGVDERGQYHHSPFWFEAKTFRREVFHSKDILDELGAVDHLAVAFFRCDIEDIFGIPGPVRIEPITVEKLKGIQHRSGLFSDE